MFVMDLLRHGALQGGVKYRGRVEEDLTKAGREQMDSVWSAVRDEVDMVVTSPLSRCAIAAQAWAESKGIACIVDERLAEMHYGAWEGLTHEEIECAFPGMLKQWRQDPSGMRPPGGESPEELRLRVQDFWSEVSRIYQGKHALCVGHSGSMRMLLACIQNQPIGYTREIEMPYACWNRVQCDEQSQSSVIFLNKQTD